MHECAAVVDSHFCIHFVFVLESCSQERKGIWKYPMLDSPSEVRLEVRSELTFQEH